MEWPFREQRTFPSEPFPSPGKVSGFLVSPKSPAVTPWDVTGPHSVLTASFTWLERTCLQRLSQQTACPRHCPEGPTGLIAPAASR